MRVVATAGHVDHGKSTLVRALTGTDPDRWAEEHRRGLTIDLGYAWTDVDTPAGPETLAFVDVPGHQRFIGNMLAGLGPSPAVLLVVAADEGWRRQTSEHLAAVRALGIRHGVVALTRADLVDAARIADSTAEVRDHLAGTDLAAAEVIAVSAATGAGLDGLRAALGRLLAGLPAPATGGRARLWVDRVFTRPGAGTVVTGTLESGTLRPGDAVEVAGRTATVRALQSLGRPVDAAPAVGRVAVALRGIGTDAVARGDAVLTPGAWRRTTTADVALAGVADAEDLPTHLMAHVGTGAVEVRLRPLAGSTYRLTWGAALPLTAGDRLVLRDPGRQEILGGAVVLDADPPALTRRGAARARGEDLAAGDAALDVDAEVARRGWMPRRDLLALGATPAELDAATSRRCGDVLVSPARWEGWTTALARVVADAVAADPLQARAPEGAAADGIGLPGTLREALPALAEAAGLERRDGYLHVPGREPSLGPAEAGLATVERRLASAPFAAPERDELAALRLGPRELAVAVRLGRLVSLGEDIYLLRTAPALAMRELATLPQPFTTSQARQALGTTRRVVIPLLEELDRRGWTRRLDAGHRQIVR